MDEKTKISILNKSRIIGVPVFLLLSALFACALLGDPYQLRRRPGIARPHSMPEIAYKPVLPLDSYLGVIRSREMFKPSIVYETKKSEVINVLGDLIFLGVVRDGSAIQACIMNKKSGQSSFYKPGQALEELEIQEIAEDKVVFKHGEEILQLSR